MADSTVSTRNIVARLARLAPAPTGPQVPTARRRQFGPPGAEPVVEAPKVEEKPKREKRVKQKNDPKLIAAARELRDRYLEQVESGKYLPPVACGKYDVSRTLSAVEGTRTLTSSVESQIEDHGRDAHATGEATKLLAA